MLSGNNLDFGRYQILNAVLQNLSSAPGSPVEGLMYYDTTLHAAGVYQNSTWIYLGASGVFTASSTDALTNKTINASLNTISNLTLAMFAANVIDTDGTLAANSDTRVATQKAVKTAIASAIASAVIFKGVIDCSLNPNYPAAIIGDLYKVSVSGKIGGSSGQLVTAGDSLYCTTANAGGTDASVGADWDIVQSNLDQATSSTLGSVQLASQAEAEAKSNTAKAVVPADLGNFGLCKIATIGDGVTTSIIVTDNLTIDKIAECRDATTGAKILVDITYAANTTTFIFGVAPASNAYKVVIIGI